MLQAHPFPSAGRIVAAFFVAPLAPSVVLACMGSLTGGPLDRAMQVLDGTATIWLLIAYPLTLVLGVPAFLILRGRVQPSALNWTLAGAVIASGPWVLLVAAELELQAWIENGRFIGANVALGALGGFTFWIVAAARPWAAYKS